VEKCIQHSGRNTGRKIQLGRPGNRWEDIKIYFKERRCSTGTRFLWLRMGTSGRIF
jgi:hypothetical protein